MIVEGCQGKAKEIQFTEKVCPNCGESVEIFSSDPETICPECGFSLFNDQYSCARWCSQAKECFGEELYNKIMASLDRMDAEEIENEEDYL